MLFNIIHLSLVQVGYVILAGSISIKAKIIRKGGFGLALLVVRQPRGSFRTLCRDINGQILSRSPTGLLKSEHIFMVILAQRSLYI